MNPTYIIQLPIRLYVESNDSSHWRIKYQRHKKHTMLIRHEWRKLPPVSLPVRISLTRIGKRRVDEDNLIGGCFKHIRDCVADLLIPGLAKGQADGNPQIMSWQYHQEIGKTYALKIEIFQL